MSKVSPSAKITIFVSHAFNPKDVELDVGALRDAVVEAVRLGTNASKAKKVGLSVETVFSMPLISEGLVAQIEAALKATEIAIVDISDNNPNVMYELGYLRSKGVPCVILKSEQSKHFEVPVDIRDRYINYYAAVGEIVAPLVKELSRLIDSIISNQSYNAEYFTNLWFSEGTEQLYIVSSSEGEKTRFADLSEEDYIFLDNLGDRDAVLETAVLMARHYPKVKPQIFPADDFYYRFVENDLIVIGGPGDATEGNKVCADIMKTSGLVANYSADGLSLEFNGECLTPEYDENGKVIKDVGYFAKIANPYNLGRTVILVHGMHTFGVLGAVRAMSDHTVAVSNHEAIMAEIRSEGQETAQFECAFHVEVKRDGSVPVPHFDANFFRLL